MKKLKYLISFFLVFVMLFGVGCSCKGETPEENVIETIDSYLVEKGKSDYKIILPANYTAREWTAKDELVTFFKEATGITLPFATDNEVEYTADSKFICIGKTAFAENHDIIPTYHVVKENGFIIKTIDKSMFLIGFSDFGTLYAVYALLELEFDYDYYTVDSYSITKVKNDVQVKKYDITDVPDINMLESNYGYIQNDATVANRYRMMMRSEIYIPINGNASVHNTLNYFPKNVYEKEYPDFYSSDGTDICFTAHGKPDMFELMTDFATKEIIEEFESGQKGTLIIIGQQDINKTCVCDGCLAVTQQYGEASAKGIIFCNKVLEKVYSWFETQEGQPYQREFYMMLLAYEKFVDAPVSLVDGAYVPNNGLIIHKNFGAMSAPIKNDFTISRAENEEQFNHFKEWSAISNVFSLYAYDTNFQEYLMPFNTFDSKQDIYQEMKRINCISLFDHSQSNNFGLASGWSMLKSYLESKLRWDTTIDMNEYTEKYFYGVYGEEVGEDLMNVFYSFRAHWNYLKNEIAEGRLDTTIGGHMENSIKSSLWPLNLLKGWQSTFENAMEKIAHLETTDPQEYQRLYKLIAAERMSVTYMLLRLYSAYYSESELLDLRLLFKADTSLCNVNILGPTSKTVSSMLSEWGI